MNKKLLWGIILVLCLSMTAHSGFAAIVMQQGNGVPSSNGTGFSFMAGYAFLVYNGTVNMTGIQGYHGMTADTWHIINDDTCAPVASGSFDNSSGSGVAYMNVELTNGTRYFIGANMSASGATYTRVFGGSGTLPITRAYVKFDEFTYSGGAGTCVFDTTPWHNIKNFTINLLDEPISSTNDITFNLYNNVTGNLISTTYGSNFTGNYNFTYYNITTEGFCVKWSGAGSGANCSGGSNIAPSYFNLTREQNISATTIFYDTTYQALLNVSATRLYLNTTINSFNVTNNKTTNTTTTGTLYIKANEGDNVLNVGVLGNYTLGYNCVAARLSTTSCTTTGVYDTLITVAAKYNNQAVASFNSTLSNTTLLLEDKRQTSNGTIVYPAIQGYLYSVLLNSSNHTIATDNATITSNNYTFNITLLTLNTFNITFYNESTNNVINQDITVELISDSYANNFTAENGTLEVTLLTPDAYTIRYYRVNAVPREYYISLTPQTYNNLRLYIVDEGISSLYVPEIVDQAGYGIGGATISLLRYYIDINGYRTVEMAKTDTNGQAVLRVVPNIINYKLLISSGGKTIVTEPSKLTSSTDTYTFNTLSNPLLSSAANQNIQRSITFNNATNTYSYTWTDGTGIVTGACLTITYFNRTRSNQEYYACTTGNTGSLIYTVQHNTGRYIATGILNTSTQYSTLLGDSEENILSSTSTDTFGLIGIFLTILVFLAFSLMGSGRTELVVGGGIFAIFLMGLFGFITYTWASFVGILIVGVIIAYKTRT